MVGSHASLSETLECALNHHRAGRYGPALELYQELLGRRPDEVGILVNHGIAALQAGLRSSLDDLSDAWVLDRGFEPNVSEDERAQKYQGWKDAVGRILTG